MQRSYLPLAWTLSLKHSRQQALPKPCIRAEMEFTPVKFVTTNNVISEGIGYQNAENKEGDWAGSSGGLPVDMDSNARAWMQELGE